ncbi:hypothetical protein ES319_D01G152800v1 [Gossypium barbadense]|uniref:Uncharacterized protein n=1 Tax=Gossypium barbadense TaxID=3634 RepID=A0A5J5SP45_GOSBA|nr:hypothetical protein ES319_D01G152800v1 [Gossypium barbadense]
MSYVGEEKNGAKGTGKKATIKKYLASFEANGVSVTVHECSLLKSFSTSLIIANLYVAIYPCIVEDSISSSWKSPGLALLQVEC